MPTIEYPSPFVNGLPPIWNAPSIEPPAPDHRFDALAIMFPPIVLPIAPDPPYCAACSNLVTGKRVYHEPEQCPRGAHGDVIRSARDVLEAAGYIVIAPSDAL